MIINFVLVGVNGFKDPKAHGLDESKIPVMELSEFDLVIHTFKPNTQKNGIYLCLFKAIMINANLDGKVQKIEIGNLLKNVSRLCAKNLG